MRIVGIDPGKTTGVAVIEADGDGWQLCARYDRQPTGDARGEQLADLRRGLGLEMQRADAVAMEELARGGPIALGGWSGFAHGATSRETSHPCDALARSGVVEQHNTKIIETTFVADSESG